MKILPAAHRTARTERPIETGRSARDGSAADKASSPVKCGTVFMPATNIMRSAHAGRSWACAALFACYNRFAGNGQQDPSSQQQAETNVLQDARRPEKEREFAGIQSNQEKREQVRKRFDSKTGTQERQTCMIITARSLERKTEVRRDNHKTQTNVPKGERVFHLTCELPENPREIQQHSVTSGFCELLNTFKTPFRKAAILPQPRGTVRAMQFRYFHLGWRGDLCGKQTTLWLR